ncbi:hypothetical protein [Ascidiimonas aurantiaca]|uniref:hypothetical protein n=1 Tax=Ascidiimonas aurantiaca TaxID=1685432 RepID=UPI0030EB912A
MKLKYKSLLYNFLGFALLFLAIRFGLGALAFFPDNRVLLAITAAVIANILAPKFGVVTTENGEKLFMKWLFLKGVKEWK